MFEPVLDDLVDFDAKTLISASVIYIDNPPTIRIEYEPALERSKFSKEVTGVVRKIAMARHDGPAPHVLIRSERRRQLLALLPSLGEDGDYCFSIAQEDRDRWARKVADLALPEGYLDIALAAIPHHPIWTELDCRARVAR